jgi:hypothetical protein
MSKSEKTVKTWCCSANKKQIQLPYLCCRQEKWGAPTCARLLGTQCPNTQGQIFNEGLVKLEDPTVPSFPPLILLLVTGKFSINQNLDKMAFTISGLGQFQ